MTKDSLSIRLPRMVGVGLMLTGLLAGCNTVHGAGQDVSSVGHDVSRGATAAKNGIVNSTGASGQ